jgi:hypothetical protein
VTRAADLSLRPVAVAARRATLPRVTPATALRRGLLVAGCVLALPATAHALPGDHPIVPLAPADGATVPANPDGISVAYACPGYTVAVYEAGDTRIVDTGDAGDYQVRFSDSPALGPDGLLASQPYGSDASATAEPGGSCTSTLDTYDTASSPEIVGGRVYWQAYRDCLGCTPQWETAPVRSFVVRPSVSARLRTAARVYAGYLGVYSVTSEAELSGARVLLQRRAGKRWRTVAEESFGERTELVAKLPGGRQALRAVVVAGAARFTVAKRTLRVRRGGRRATGGRDDGRYADPKPSRNSTLRFRVAGGGRTLREFKASLTAFCVGPSLADNRLVIAYAALRSARVAPDGSVTGLLKTRKGARVLLTGRLRAGRFKGEVTMRFSTCSGSRKLGARRT